ncbi:MAG: cytochrome C biogenesis protein, partial [Muribaculaceae bacterium]
MTLRILIKRPATLLIHIAFAVIVVGGVVTWLTSRQGSITVGKVAATDCLSLNSGDSINLPFAVKLSHFEVVNYPGTDSPMD